MNLYPAFKFFAFMNDPESVHDLSMKTFKHFPFFSALFPSVPTSDKYSITDGHMTWNFPVGLAAGFDKNAQAIDYFSRVGFGAVEVGTVTKEPQIGNARPRIWRLPKENSIRNAMGFPNTGSQIIRENILASVPAHSGCLGVNIGKNKNTSVQDTPEEYAYLYEYFANDCDYLVINISSPNTPGLRDLQTKEAFRDICTAVDEKRKMINKPLYLKIAPDLSEQNVRDMIELSKEFKLSGIIATNTTIQHDLGSGGVSGKLIKDVSYKIRKQVCEMTKETGELSVIGVGGIDSFAEILEFWKQGGDFVQIFSSFIYQGPQVLRNIQFEIDKVLKESQAKNLQEWLQDFKSKP